ncbi:MAG: hypothetical protein RL641_626 [Candidatus Parcubacteria bacterium]|jgi:putative PIN family toxin of toxin-antitoxin system
MSASRKIIVLDSSLVVSAILSPKGTSALALSLAVDKFELASSKETIEELVEVLTRKKFDKYATEYERMERAEVYIQDTMQFHVSITVTDCRDPKDNKFLALARQANAVLIVSGDRQDLLSMNPYHTIKIIGVREFIETYQQYASL